MSLNPSSSHAPDPLTIGNVVSAAIRIYRDRFKSYYLLALLAYFRLLLPLIIVSIPLAFLGVGLARFTANFQTNQLAGGLVVVIGFLGVIIAFVLGLAKFFAILGRISRLAYRELIEAPETVQAARQFTHPRRWIFFRTALLVSLITLGVLFISLFVLGLVVGLPLVLVTQDGAASPSLVIIAVLLGLLAFVALLWEYIWLYSRLSVHELAIAIEANMSPSQAIARSWRLTKGYVWRIQGIFLVAVLISIPVSIMIQIVSSILQLIFAAALAEASALSAVYILLTFGVSLAGGAFLIPFWQAIKAVIYYDLQGRREGLGLSMRSQ